MKLGVLAAVSATALAVSAPAIAATVTYDSATVNGDSISITNPSAVVGEAGLITLSLGGSLVAQAWCFDVFNTLINSGNPQTYDVRPFDPSSLPQPGVPPVSSPPSNNGTIPAMSANQFEEAAALAVNGLGVVASSADPSDTAAAIQIAIWEVEYGTQFSYNPASVPSVVNTLAATYLSDATTMTWTASPSQVLFLGDIPAAPNQTLITVSPSTEEAPVPEIPTWAMVLAGFGLLGFAAARKGKREARLAV